MKINIEFKAIDISAYLLALSGGLFWKNRFLKSLT